MKKLHLFLSVFIPLCTLKAQHAFAPVGAKWHYTLGPLDNGISEISCVSIECLGDTFMTGGFANIFEVKHLKDGKLATIISHEYIKHRNDTTFYYNPHLDDFVMLYNFNAAAGDTITVHASQTNVSPGFFKKSVPMFKYIIQGVDSIFFNGEWRKRQWIQPEPDFGSENWRLDSYGDSSNNQIIEGVGATSYFFGWSGMITPETMITMLRCYSETNILYQNPEWDKTCDYTWNYTGLIDYTKESDYPDIFPNPTQQTIQFGIDGLHNASYTVVDGQGKIVSTSQSSIIDVSGLSPGLYFVICRSTNQTSITRKFNKQ